MKNKSKLNLPKLKKVNLSKKKNKYKLHYNTYKRRKAINDGIKSESNKKNMKKAALSKKARFNILRIYRRFKNKKECNILTQDMKYIDKKYKIGKTKNICKGGSTNKNLLNSKLQKCSNKPLTGYVRDGYCHYLNNDIGNHLVCAKMNKSFLNFTKEKGNDLSSVVKPNQNWCLCQNRWLEAYKNKKAPKVILKATNSKVNPFIKKQIINSQNGGKNKTKKQFLYNPNNPKKSFDVYIDKNPKDTISIKYKTVNDVKNTIKKLERLFKTKKYSHKRIWQVGMIMKVRLEAMKKHKKTKFSNAKNVNQRFQLSKRYFHFLKNRTKKNSYQDRKRLTFKF